VSIRSFQIAALAFAAASLVACASGGGKATAPAPGAAVAAKESPSSCVMCKVEVENRFDFVALVFDRRDTRSDVGTINPLGKANARSSIVIQTKGRPNLGIAVLEDVGTPPTTKGLKFCRQVAVAPGSTADFHYTCGD
jgi:hypothetical protein